MKDGFIKNDQEDVVSIFEEMSDSKKDLCDRAGIIEIDFLKKNVSFILTYCNTKLIIINS